MYDKKSILAHLRNFTIPHQEMVKPHKQWSEEERTRLINAINRNKSTNNRIRWESVTPEFPDRSQIQLKAYYFNIIVRDLNNYSPPQKLQVNDRADLTPVVDVKQCSPKFTAQLPPQPETANNSSQMSPEIDTNLTHDPMPLVDVGEQCYQIITKVVHQQRSVTNYSDEELIVIFTESCHQFDHFSRHFPYDFYSDVSAAYAKIKQLTDDISDVARAVFVGQYDHISTEKVAKCLRLIDSVKAQKTNLIRAIERGDFQVDVKVRLQQKLIDTDGQRGRETVAKMRDMVGGWE